MGRSIHDNVIVGYSVDCRSREIRLQTEFEGRDGLHENTTVVFVGVEAYFFENDGSQNVIFDVVEDTAESVLAQNVERFREGHRQAGWPRFWTDSVDDVRAYLHKNQIRAFWLESSVGMSGWVLAQEMHKVDDAGRTV